MQSSGMYTWVHDTDYIQLPFPGLLTKEQTLRASLPRINTDVDQMMMMMMMMTEEESEIEAPYNEINDTYQLFGRARTHEQILRACLPRIDTNVDHIMMLEEESEIKAAYNEINDTYQLFGRARTHEQTLRAFLPRIDTNVDHIMMMEQWPEIKAPYNEINDIYQPFGSARTHEQILRACLPRIDTNVDHMMVEDERQIFDRDALLWFGSWERLPEDNKWDFIPKKWDFPEETWESKGNEESILSDDLLCSLENDELTWDKRELLLPDKTWELSEPGSQLEYPSSSSNGTSSALPEGCDVVESSFQLDDPEIFVIGEDSAYPSDDEEIEIQTCDTKSTPAPERMFDYSQPQVYLAMDLGW